MRTFLLILEPWNEYSKRFSWNISTFGGLSMVSRFRARTIFACNGSVTSEEA